MRVGSGTNQPADLSRTPSNVLKSSEWDLKEVMPALGRLLAVYVC